MDLELCELCVGSELCVDSSKLLFPFVPVGSALGQDQHPEAEWGH